MNLQPLEYETLPQAHHAHQDVKQDLTEVAICVYIGNLDTYEPHREKTGYLPMRKQRRRSGSR